MNIIFEFMLLGVFGAALVFGYKVLKAKMPQNTAYKYGVALALVAAFLLFWVNGAVGIIGNADNDANMMYSGVLAIGFFGSILSRFKPRGMALVLFLTAFSQALVAAIALVAGWGSADPSGPWDIVILSAFYCSLWTGSALLFQKAAKAERLRPNLFTDG